MRTSIKVAGGFVALVLGGWVLPDTEPRDALVPADASVSQSPQATALPPETPAADAAPEPVDPAASLTVPTAAVPTAPAPPPPPVVTALLQPAGGGDGDSWRDVTGKEYRLGLVNTPEFNECFGSAATAKRKELVADGFRADVYTTDTYGRSVAVVTTASGINLNVYLARHGFANDRFLAQFRDENPSLADQLDPAFAAAKAERAGLWGQCAGATTSSRSAAPAPVQPVAPAPVRSSAAPAPVQPVAPAGSGCHRDYVTCIPVKGNGSGSGEVNDLDCGDIRKKVQLRKVGVDPYRLDADGDGYGCESYG